MGPKKIERLVCAAHPGGQSGWFSVLGPRFGGTIVAKTLLGLRGQAQEIANKHGLELQFEAVAHLAPDLQAKVYDARAARKQAEEVQEEAQTLLATAARALVKEGFSTRDAAVVLNLSHQRVHQLLNPESAATHERDAIASRIAEPSSARQKR